MEAKANRSENHCSHAGNPQVLKVVISDHHLRPIGLPGQHPLPESLPPVLDPIARTIKLNRVLIDSGSGLNILVTKTLDDMKTLRSVLNQSTRRSTR